MTVFATKLTFDDQRPCSTIMNEIGIASCDGLVLGKDEEDNLVLINPTTREFKVLPSSPFALTRIDSYTKFGLGYDSVSDDYKVVTLSYYDRENQNLPYTYDTFVNVYSVKNGSWKRAKRSPYDHGVLYEISSVFVQGRILSLASRRSRPDYFSSIIAAFHLGKERFRTVTLPEGSKFVTGKCIAALGGCLCMLSSGGDCVTDVWMMKEYGVEESWSKFTITHSEKSEFRPLCLLGKDQDQVVLAENEEKLMIYNLGNGILKKIVVDGISDQFCVGGTFMESLVSPHCSNEDVV